MRPNKPVNKYLKIYIHNGLEDNFIDLISLVDTSKLDNKSQIIEALLCWAVDNCSKDIARASKLNLEQRLNKHPRVSSISVHNGNLEMTEGWIKFQWPDIKLVNPVVKAALLNHGFKYEFGYQAYYLRCTDIKLFNLIYNNLMSLKGV